MSNVLRLFDEPAATAAPVGDFEAVWRHWPNKANKMLAKAKYQSILKGRFNTRSNYDMVSFNFFSIVEDQSKSIGVDLLSFFGIF